MEKLISVLILFLAPFTVMAEELPVVCQEFPPYNYLDEKGNVTGTSVEIVHEVFNRLGYEANIKLLPWNRAYQKAANGSVSMLITFSKNAKRLKEFFFTDGLVMIEVVFFKRKVDDISWNELGDLKEYRIGCVQGYNYGKVMMDAIENGVLENIDFIPASARVDYQQLRKLAMNRIDLAVCPKLQCSAIIKKHLPEFASLDFIDKSVGPPRDFYGGFSKKWPNAEDLRNRFNEKLIEVKSEGIADRIFQKYEVSQ
jgi:polar amino acid transport system substrate-binding protein